jgi:sodium-dependent dicarboxylate transporter 2/3/5
VGAEVIAGELARLGRIKRPERVVLGVFLGAAALWIAGKWLTAALKPEVTLFELTSAHVEGGTAVLAAIVLLAWRTRVGEGGGGYAAGSEMPPGDGGHAAGGEARRGGGAVVRRPGERQPRRQVLSLAALRRVPWETLLLLGGGFAMAAAIQQSGLSAWMSERLLAARGLPPFGQLLLASTAVVALSAVASNTATIAVMLVVLKDAVAPDLLTTTLFAATIASSCDFALPAGTPPNAIVFGSGYVTIPRMARAGALLDLAAAAVAAAWCWVIVRAVL